MTNPKLDHIKKIITRELGSTFGYCGVADMPQGAILNSGDDNSDVVITIKETTANAATTEQS